jgi:hypothetical protein
MKHLKHYLALFSLLALAVFFFFYFAYNRQAQMGVIVATAAAYVLWGVVHHFLVKDFHWRILVEYITVATLAAILVLSLLARA